MKKTVLITGVSSGIGKATAIRFINKGFSVIGTARKEEHLSELKSQGAMTVSLDVTREESIQSAFEQIFATYPKIDVLVNNAGYSQNGFLEELTMEQLQYQFEVNVFGLIRITQMVLPAMRKAKNGRIINIGSVGGDFTTAGASAYHASKYALESFTDGMRQELKRFNIEVSLIKPGGVATNFVENGIKAYPPPIEGNPYKYQRVKFHEMLESILDPEKSNFPLLKAEQVAEIIYKAATTSKPKTRYKVGSTAKLIPIMKTLISDKAFDNMILKQLKLN